MLYFFQKCTSVIRIIFLNENALLIPIGSWFCCPRVIHDCYLLFSSNNSSYSLFCSLSYPASTMLYSSGMQQCVSSTNDNLRGNPLLLSLEYIQFLFFNNQPAFNHFFSEKKKKSDIAKAKCTF